MYAFLVGALGAALLPLLTLLASVENLADEPLRGLAAALAACTCAMLLYGSVGGAVAWAFQGRAGLFVTGLTSVGFVAGFARRRDSGTED